MAQRRMIDKKISVSEQVSVLPVEAQLIYTWSIPHADDLGLLPYHTRTLRALIVPLLDITQSTFDSHLESIVKAGLFEVYTEGESRFLKITKFLKHQTLKKDRKPNTYLDGIGSWEDVESIGFHLEYNGIPREEKRREVKIREEKRESRPEASLSFLKEMKDEEIKSITTEYGFTTSQIKGKAQDLYLYCQAKGRVYKNYRAFLLNALKKDFKPSKVQGREFVPGQGYI